MLQKVCFAILEGNKRFYSLCWQFGLFVSALRVSTKLLYVEPGCYPEGWLFVGIGAAMIN